MGIVDDGTWTDTVSERVPILQPEKAWLNSFVRDV
jgi:hypothetical protein